MWAVGNSSGWDWAVTYVSWLREDGGTARGVMEGGRSGVAGVLVSGIEACKIGMGDCVEAGVKSAIINTV